MHQFLTLNNLVLAGAAIAAWLFMLVSFVIYNAINRVSNSNATSQEKRKRKLVDLARIWMPPKKEKRKIRIEDIYHIWRKEDPAVPKTDKEAVQTFRDDRTRKFFHKYVYTQPYFKNSPLKRSVVIQLLQLLDKEGDCPSVVNVFGDSDSKKSGDSERTLLSLNENEYQLLAQVNLRNHSLNVAETLINTLRRRSPNSSMSIAPDYLLVGLAHDLGKLKSATADHYIHGQHPIGSNLILSRIKEFEKIKNKEEIEDAIKRHHQHPGKEEKNVLLGPLFESDIKSRLVERDVVVGLEKAYRDKQQFTFVEPAQSQVAAVIEATQVQVARPTRTLPPKETEPPATLLPVAAPCEKEPVLLDLQDITYVPNPTELLPREKSKTAVFDGWFNPEQFLEDLEPLVNSYRSMKLVAFSMPTGRIYVTREAMIILLKNQVKKSKLAWIQDLETEPIEFSNDEGSQQNMPEIWINMLVSVVDVLKQRNYIDSQLVCPGFYGNYFNVLMKPSNTTKKYFYTVFKAESFKTTIPELEKKKISAFVRGISRVTLAQSEKPTSKR